VGGAIVGIFRATLVTTLVLMVIALAPLPYLQRSVREKSLTGMYFLKFGVDVYEKASLALPMLKREGKVFAKERILEDLSKDKSIVQASGEEKPQRKKGSDDLP
jgi:hypothetical protein